MNVSRIDLKVSYLNTEKLIPYINNPRNNIAAIDKVAASIQEFGFQQPIVIDDEHVIIAGHTRYLAAQKLELNKVPVVIAKDLTKHQKQAYRIADNRVAQEATWDDELLQLELSDLDDSGYDLELTGFDLDEIEALLTDPEPNTDTSEQDYLSRYQITVDCDNESQQEKLYSELKKRGFQCKVVSI